MCGNCRNLSYRIGEKPLLGVTLTPIIDYSSLVSKTKSISSSSLVVLRLADVLGVCVAKGWGAHFPRVLPVVMSHIYLVVTVTSCLPVHSHARYCYWHVWQLRGYLYCTV